jgi:hypothetical protein
MERLSPGDVIGRAFGIYRDQIGVLLPAALLVFAVDAVVTWLLDEGALALIAGLVSLVLATLYQGMVVQLVRDVQDGRRDNSMGELFGSVSPVLVPLIFVSLLAGLGIGIGFLLLIIPGLVLLTFWSVVAPVTVIERPGVFSAFSRSWGLVRGHAWPVFGTIVLVFLIVVAAAIVASIIGAASSDGVRAILSWIFDALTQPIAALTASVLYFTLLRVRGEGPASEVTAGPSPAAAAPAGYEPSSPSAAPPASEPSSAPPAPPASEPPSSPPATPPASEPPSSAPPPPESPPRPSSEPPPPRPPAE